ncbi:unnamed protein product [Phaeothamnion confervicola]
MSLEHCTLTWPAFLTCASHAATTEKQEIMGLLLGSWEDDSSHTQRRSVRIEHAMVLTRTDRRKDRVEVGYEQLASASSLCEELSARVNKPTRVVGWYHSHPHITVVPSQVDVATQASYQQMDAGFVGLIFSIFVEDSGRVGKMEVTCFQSVKKASEPSLPPSAGGGGSSSGGDGGGGGGGIGGWQRREVALSLLPPEGGSSVPLADAAARIVALQDTLYHEERDAYLTALRQNRTVAPACRDTGPAAAGAGAGAASGSGGGGGGDADDSGGGGGGGGCGVGGQSGGDGLAERMYCAAVYQKALSFLMGESAMPLVHSLRARLDDLKSQASELRRQNQSKWEALTPQQQEEVRNLVEKRRHRCCSAIATCTGAGQFAAMDKAPSEGDAASVATEWPQGLDTTWQWQYPGYSGPATF